MDNFILGLVIGGFIGFWVGLRLFGEKLPVIKKVRGEFGDMVIKKLRFKYPSVIEGSVLAFIIIVGFLLKLFFF